LLNANWLGAPRLRTLRTIGARGIKIWRAFGAPSHFQLYNVMLIKHAYIYFIITSMHEAISLLVNVRTPNYV